MKKDLPKKPSTKLRDTHVVTTPFLDDLGRFVHVCFCGYHLGIIRPSTLVSKAHCGERCANLRKVYFNYRFVDEDQIKETLESQKRMYRLTPTVKVTPFEKDGQKYFWVLDRGEYIYFLRPEKAYLLPNIDQDHKRIDISNLLSNNFKPYFAE
jgi:hypothetical protein